ncbi:MAG: 3'-5' exonuclease [Clostridia bacterium]|nr:3'-5' exonuclease [Clostridia bacterium]
MERVIAFDVETPNSWNDRMSAIGVALIEDGKITGKYATLVNPETRFDAFNIALTGITPEMVRGAPTFPMLWEKIGRLFQSGVLIAHNAPFDMRVLACCLKDYGIAAPASLPYACTVQMGRKCYPHLPDHKLNTLCSALRIPLDHHKADSDCLACAYLYLNYREHGLDLKPYLRAYDLNNLCTMRR